MKQYISSDKWTKYGSVCCIGYLYYKEHLYKGAELSILLEQISSTNEADDLLRTANGQFAFIINKPDLEVAAIDGSRLYPLFYTINNGELHVSDNPEALDCKIKTIDETAKREYNSSGAVFSGKTLFKEIRQIQPFHYLIYNNNKITQYRYYTYAVKKTEIKQHTFDETEACLSKVFDRMLNTTQGRQIVLPLSGGLDSRLIACMLKKKGVKNVYCYTVSKCENKEVQTAKKVAETLGYPFLQINPNEKDVVPGNYLHSDEFEQYYHYLGAYTNFVWLYDFFAVKYLKEHKTITDDAIFVPGHSGDFLAGSHIDKVQMKKEASASYIASSLSYDYFEYGYDSKLYDEVKHFFEKDINDYLPYSVYLNFDAENRLAHQINNSARIYEFFGYEVRLPFWDKELMDLFKTTPFEELQDKEFYRSFLRDGIFKEFGVNYEGKQHTAAWVFIKQKIKNRIKRFLPVSYRHKHAQLDDIVGEKEMAVPMLKELTECGYYDNDQCYTSNNQIIKDWYLMRITKDIYNKQ